MSPYHPPFISIIIHWSIGKITAIFILRNDSIIFDDYSKISRLKDGTSLCSYDKEDQEQMLSRLGVVLYYPTWMFEEY